MVCSVMIIQVYLNVTSKAHLVAADQVAVARQHCVALDEVRALNSRHTTPSSIQPGPRRAPWQPPARNTQPMHTALCAAGRQAG